MYLAYNLMQNMNDCSLRLRFHTIKTWIYGTRFLFMTEYLLKLEVFQEPKGFFYLYFYL